MYKIYRNDNNTHQVAIREQCGEFMVTEWFADKGITEEYEIFEYTSPVDDRIAARAMAIGYAQSVIQYAQPYRTSN